MSLPFDFTFSQYRLQDYLACPRRFELRYLQQRAWPAVPSEPVQEMEHHQEMGERFHQLAYQHRLGMPLDILNAYATEPCLLQWWQDYLQYAPSALPKRQLPEMTLAFQLGGYRLVAKFDLLAIEPGERCIIVDWKTGQRRQRREHLHERMQTRLYPLALVQAGTYLNGSQPILPEQVEMIYWFTADPANPEVFYYSQQQMLEDQKEIAALIDAIAENAGVANFPSCSDERTCSFCVYRSLCERGVEAGAFDPTQEWEDEPTLSLDFDQVEAIVF